MASLHIQVRLLKDGYNNHTFYGWRLMARGAFLPCSKEEAINFLAKGAEWVGKKGTEPTA
jgi:hypothetical protein